MFCDHGKKMNGILHVMTGQVLPLLICVAIWLISAGPAHSAIIINAPMTDTNSSGWVLGGTPASSILTGDGATDPVGQGWLRLTNNTGNQTGFAYNNTSFDLSQGVLIQFDYATWGGNGADGYSVYLFDANVPTFNIGAFGGSLGYAQKLPPAVTTAVPGISGGYVGIGVDEFGNFSNPTEGRYLGPGQSANTVTIRGPVVGFGGGAVGSTQDATSYPWIATSANNGSLWYNGTPRPSQTGADYRKVVIRISPAPNPVVSVWIQFGYNQPLTQMIFNQALPSIATAQLLKIGYAASTGGSTNYHEIRNLLVTSLNTSTAIDLGITKTASVTSATVPTPITYTVTARNYGPNNVTATGVGIVDNVPTSITGVTWTCAGSGGGTCGAASGSGNAINTTANLPMNGIVTYAINGTIGAGTPLGTQITNTAALTIPGAITDYNSTNNSASVTTTVTSGVSINITGTIFNDNGAGGGIAHNGIRDGGETVVTATNVGNTYYVKIYSSNDLSTLVGSATVAGGASTYSISVPAYGTYTIILSTDATANFTPSLSTNGQWIYTLPLNYTLTNVTANGANLPNQNFGVIQGTRISGRVINDNGAGGGIANDGSQNGSETGISGVTVWLANNTGGTTYDTTTTDSAGNFALFTNTASATLRIYETNLAGYVSVNFNAGNTAGAYTIAGEYIQFAYTRYTDYSGVVFSDVAANTFLPTPRAANVTAGSSVYYAHTFTPGSGGSVTFSTAHTRGTWPAIVLYRDADCSGSYQAGDAVISSAITATAGVPVCILVQDTVPAGAANGLTDVITTTAAFTYTNSPGPVTSPLTVTDTTTVVAPASLTIVKSASPSPSVNPGQVVTYTILVTNTGAGVATNVAVTDSLSPYTYFGINPYAGAPFQLNPASSGLVLGTPVYSNDHGLTWSYGPLASGGGGAPTNYDGNVTNWTIPLTGSMPAGSNFTINFQVQVK